MGEALASEVPALLEVLARGLASISLTFSHRKMTTASPSPGRVAKWKSCQHSADICICLCRSRGEREVLSWGGKRKTFQISARQLLVASGSSWSSCRTSGQVGKENTQIISCNSRGKMALEKLANRPEVKFLPLINLMRRSCPPEEYLLYRTSSSENKDIKRALEAFALRSV